MKATEYFETQAQTTSCDVQKSAALVTSAQRCDSHDKALPQASRVELYLVLVYWPNVVERSYRIKSYFFAIYTAVTSIKGNAFFGHSHRK